MDIVIIGSGNAAAVLGRKMVAAGHRILQVVSRNAAEASELAYEWETESTNYQSVINRSADIYIVAVSDAAIAEVVDDLRLPGKVIAHTAAAVPAKVLQHVSPHFGVFYPLQSLRKESNDIPQIPIFFEGNDEIASKKLEELAISIAGDQVLKSNADERIKLHLAAVMVNNFVNHLYVLAEEFCKKEGLDFKQLLPIIRETAERVQNLSPKSSQTGPAIRHDRESMDQHLLLLAGYPRIQQFYQLFSESIEGK